MEFCRIMSVFFPTKALGIMSGNNTFTVSVGFCRVVSSECSYT
jgi:hypothetical protein